MSTSWDPDLYLAFDDHRSRPFRDLLSRVGARNPREVVDLGCGPGHLTEALSARWPAARVTALDSSAEMVEAARVRGVDAQLGDVTGWTPGPETDVVVTNAVLQWVPGHRRLLRDWVAALPADGWLAMQVPGNFDAPSHALVREVAADPRWAEALALRSPAAVDQPIDYADLVTAAGAEADVWETTYVQRLEGEDPVLQWISGTALRPVRDALGDKDYDAFRAELAPRLRAAYPRRPDGTTWFPFRRIFVVAHRPAAS